jgi:hypothetical protein
MACTIGRCAELTHSSGVTGWRAACQGYLNVTDWNFTACFLNEAIYFSFSGLRNLTADSNGCWWYERNRADTLHLR